MKNEIRFTLKSKQRPKLAQEIGNILGTALHYERVPSCAYDIAGYRLDKEGVLHIPDGTEKEIVEDLILQLRERGFQDDMEITEEVPVQQDKLTIAIPKESLTDMALENLQKIIANKQTLFQCAFQTDSTEIEITEEKINFTWFPYTVDGDDIAAYTQFISRLCDMARDAKRVSSKPTKTDNDKYEIIKLYLSVDKKYRKHGTWLMNDETALALRTLKDSAGNYLWKESDETIFSKPVQIVDSMPSIGKGQKVIAFGDFSNYWLVQRFPLTIRTLKEKFAMRGQVGYLGCEYLDGKLIRKDAVKVLQMAAD